MVDLTQNDLAGTETTPDLVPNDHDALHQVIGDLEEGEAGALAQGQQQNYPFDPDALFEAEEMAELDNEFEAMDKFYAAGNQWRQEQGFISDC